MRSEGHHDRFVLMPHEQLLGPLLVRERGLDTTPSWPPHDRKSERQERGLSRSISPWSLRRRVFRQRSIPRTPFDRYDPVVDKEV
jgi:hypothetical protein